MLNALTLISMFYVYIQRGEIKRGHRRYRHLCGWNVVRRLYISCTLLWNFRLSRNAVLSETLAMLKF